MKLEFKKGSKYSRKDIGWICYPETGPPSRGNWETGYVRFENELIIFTIFVDNALYLRLRFFLGCRVMHGQNV